MDVLCKKADFAPDLLRQTAINLREASGRVVVLGSVYEGKPNLVVAVSSDLSEKLNAQTLVRAGGKFIQGGGGGQPTLAMAGGKNPDGVDEAISEIVKIVKETLK